MEFSTYRIGEYNTDKSSRGNLGESFYGLCITDSEGYLIYAKANPIGVATNIETEIIAILKAISECKSRNLSNISIETNSLSLRNISMRECQIP